MESAVVIDDAASARRAAAQVPGCYKLLSWLYLHVLEVPTVPGVVVHRWDDDAVAAVRELCRRVGATSVMVRSDQRVEGTKSVYGGRIVALDQLAEPVTELLGMGRTVFLLEPVSLLDMSLSAAAAYWPPDDVIVVELLGAGFDASDLKWGEITPHEVFLVPRHGGGPADLRDARVRLVDEAGYRASVQHRLDKVERLAGPGGVDGETGRLRDGRPYAEVTADQLWGIVTTMRRLVDGLPGVGAPEPPLATYMNCPSPTPGRSVWWDVVWPRLKYHPDPRARRR